VNSPGRRDFGTFDVLTIGGTSQRQALLAGSLPIDEGRGEEQ